ncbi:hypothetical protein PLESTM_002041700 [Pleodorina starrii]|nr:hypothetical protein PLESTM_002041700 [Pleodorina starrii]
MPPDGSRRTSCIVRCHRFGSGSPSTRRQRPSAMSPHVTSIAALRRCLRLLPNLLLIALSLQSMLLTAQELTASAGTAEQSPVPPSSAALEPLWGCESPSLPSGALHIVVSTYNADPEQLLPWLWHLGLTNALVYIYYRIDDPYIQRQYHGTVQLPCNMSLHVLPLLPNKGREAAAFLHHIVTHYENLPQAMLLAHDHGPASRHSLCGPFYRRARGFYRGLVEQRDRAAAEAEAAEAAAGSGGDGDGGRKAAVSKRSHFERLASMVVTLSSGCVELWAKGCCAAFMCSNSRRSCPFDASDNCTASEPSKRAPGGYRHIYMHQYGMYDARYENQVLGPDGGARPVALLRYVGAAHRSTDMWNISHEYPPDEQRHTKERTLELLKELLERYNFAARRKSWFKSCCASLLVRREALRRWPVELYKDLLAYSMDPAMDYEATKAVSGPAWSLWLDRDYTPQDTMTYLRVDFALKHMKGCPAQYTPALQALVRHMRIHAAGGPETTTTGLAGGGAEGGPGGEGAGAGGGEGGAARRTRALRHTWEVSGGGRGGSGGVRIPFRREGPAAAASSLSSSSSSLLSP